MTQPSNRRFVMEDRLPLESADLAVGSVTNDQLAADSVTSDKILNGTIVNADINASAAIAATKVQGTLPTGGTTGQILSKIDGTNYNTTWIDNFAPNVELYVKNQSGSAMTKGQVVYIAGVDNAGDTPRVALADADAEATSSKTIGRLKQDLADGAFGYVVTEGLIEGLNTAAATAGQSIWLSGTAGGVVYGAPPAKPAHSVYLGVVIRAQTNNGKVYVKVQNGYELEELHNVNINSGTLATGQALTYDGSSSMWVNSTPASTLNDLTDVTITSGTLAGGQVIKYDAGTTQWVNGAAAGGVTASATAPNLSTSAAGDAWFDTNDGTLYVCYVDVDSTKQWVQVKANSALEGTILGRLSSLEGQAVAFGNLSPNYIINGAFDIWQRGTTYSGAGYGSADRWYIGLGGTATVSRQSSGAPIGAQYYARMSYGASSSFANMYMAFEQNTVSQLVGKTVTLTAKVRRNSTFATNLIIDIQKGTVADTMTSGTWTTVASSYVLNANIPTGTGSSNWYTLSVTAAIPNDGTVNGMRIRIGEGDVGPSGAYWELANVQLEVGSQATAFRRNQPNIQAELAACQRYYQRLPGGVGLGSGANGGGTTYWWCHTFFPVQMRSAPTPGASGSIMITDDYAGDFTSSSTSVTGYQMTSTGGRVQYNGWTGLTSGRWYGPVYGGTGYVDFSAEL